MSRRKPDVLVSRNECGEEVYWLPFSSEYLVVALADGIELMRYPGVDGVYWHIERVIEYLGAELKHDPSFWLADDMSASQMIDGLRRWLRELEENEPHFPSGTRGGVVGLWFGKAKSR